MKGTAHTVNDIVRASYSEGWQLHLWAQHTVQSCQITMLHTWKWRNCVSTKKYFLINKWFLKIIPFPEKKKKDARYPYPAMPFVGVSHSCIQQWPTRAVAVIVTDYWSISRNWVALFPSTGAVATVHRSKAHFTQWLRELIHALCSELGVAHQKHIIQGHRGGSVG